MTRAQALIAATKLAGSDLDATVVVTLRPAGGRSSPGEVAVEVPSATSLDGIVALRDEVLALGYVAELEAGYLEVKRAAEPGA